METVLSTPGIMDDYGDVTVGEFLPPQIREAEPQITWPERRGGPPYAD
jgi:hypothetical protein